MSINEIFSSEKTGMYRDVKILGVFEDIMPRGRHYLRADATFWHASPIFSIILLWGHKNRFFKIRYSMTIDQNLDQEKIEAIVQNIINGIDQFLAQN